MNEALNMIIRINFNIAEEVIRVANLPVSDKKAGILYGLEVSLMQLRREYRLLNANEFKAIEE